MAGAGLTLGGGHQFMQDAAGAGVTRLRALTAGLQLQELLLQRMHAGQAGAHSGQLFGHQAIHVGAVALGASTNPSRRATVASGMSKARQWRMKARRSRWGCA